MRLYSTNNPSEFVALKDAVFKGLPSDNGLFMPEHIPVLPASFFEELRNDTFQQTAFKVTKHLLQGVLPDDVLQEIINGTVSFPVPLVELKDNQYVLELFHGPTLAFKDFGARFMSRLMSYFIKGDKEELVILVATSGDTGSAVASGFYDIEGIRVVVLYPNGKVSDLQERQMTTLGKNITALRVNGTFDDCQSLVKQAFLNDSLNNTHQLTSANSINIARLIPQMFYYFEGYKQLLQKGINGREVVFAVPSGNFGNITAGLMAKRMGLPIDKFIAAVNDNDVFYQYQQTGEYKPRPSVQTVSNAMDVGAPSNFARMMDLYQSDWEALKSEIDAGTVSDEMVKQLIKDVYNERGYVLDPHTAVGMDVLNKYQLAKDNTLGVVLSTAHPAKFNDVVEMCLEVKIALPDALSSLVYQDKIFTEIGVDFEGFKSFLLGF
jgi:threonine synthase